MRRLLKKIFPGNLQNHAEAAPGAAAKVRGDAFLGAENWGEAERCYREALALDAQFAKAHSNLGYVLARQGRDVEASTSLQRALELDPANPDTHYILGDLAAKRGHRSDEACARFREALRLAPDFEAAHVALCNLLLLRRELKEATAELTEAQAHCPASSELYRLRGELEYEEMRFSAAVASFEQALAIDPANTSACVSLGHALLRLDRRDAAMAAFERAISGLRAAASAGGAKAQFNLGAALLNLARYDEAQACFAQSLALQPGSSEVRIADGWLRLLRGDFTAGWRSYREVALHGAMQHVFSQPLWDGCADLAGKAILLYADQGMGDTLQLVRYVREIRARGAAAVYLDVQPPLRALLAAMPEVTRVLEQGEPLDAFDFYCPMSNLPAACSTTLDAMPDARPYIAASAAASEGWRRRLGGEGALRVGVVWSGNPQFRNDRQRSMFLCDLRPLFARSDCRFYLLQKDVRTVDLPELRELLASRGTVCNLGDALVDFATTAAIVANLDVVITVDTSVAHLVGAMGKPVWIMLPFAPDFRWLLGRSDSPWYPSAHLFRQPRIGDWASVVAELGVALAGWRR